MPYVDKDKQRAAWRAYYHRNRDVCLARNRNWKAKNWDRHLEQCRRHRAKKQLLATQKQDAKKPRDLRYIYQSAGRLRFENYELRLARKARYRAIHKEELARKEAERRTQLGASHANETKDRSKVLP